MFGRWWRMAAFAVCHRLPSLLLLVTIAAGPSGFTFRIAETGPLEPLTPQLADSVTLQIKALVYESLLTPDQTGELVPWLARNWQWLPNGNLYVEPDPDRTFSDGSTVTRQEIIDSLIAFGLNATPLGTGLEIAPGASRLRPEVVLPHAAIFKMVPGGYLGTGPFFIASQDPERIVLRRTFSVPYRIDQVELIGYETPGEAMRSLLTGECHGTLGIRPEVVEFYTELQVLNRFQIIPRPPMHTYAIIFNRKVLSAKDRQILLARLQAAGLLGVRPVPSGWLGVELASLGPGPRMSLITWNADKGSYRLALTVRHVLGLRGGEVLSLSIPEIQAAMDEGKFGIIVDAVQTWPEAEGLALWRSQGPVAPFIGYSNPALDAALEAGDWKAARRAFDLDPPGLFLMERQSYAVIDSQILNPTIGRYLQFETLPSWEVP